MTTFRKMTLIAEDELDRLREKQVQTYQPVVRSAANVEDELREVLDNKTLPADMKLTLFNLLHSRFRELKKEGEKPLKLGGEEKETSKAAATLPSMENVAKGRLIGMINKPFHKKLANLLSFLSEKIGRISVGESNQLVLDGTPVTGSNIYDLIKFLYSHPKTEAPEGFSEFLEFLISVNVPLDYISNPWVKAQIRTTTPQQEGQGLRPPGIAAHPSRKRTKSKLIPKRTQSKLPQSRSHSKLISKSILSKRPHIKSKSKLTHSKRPHFTSKTKRTHLKRRHSKSPKVLHVYRI